MLFNSIDFAFFLPIVFTLYWLLNNKLRLQNLLITLSSYVFYGWWDTSFLILIIFSTIIDFSIAILLERETKKLNRKILLFTSLAINLGFLGYFKYCNFFIENFSSAFSFFGHNIQANSLNIILPVGISFYTFQTLSYSIDVYRKEIKPTKDFIAFSAFVCFFPQLVAGPIERATNLLPQFIKQRKFDYAKSVDGLKQILWGLFKKLVIADNCAKYANLIFDNSHELNGSTLLLGSVFFAFQIYGDFSGYSDIAIGTSRLFGFNLMRNFHFPYFSRDIAEFWRRWHISLNTWFRDYIYIPLGGSKGSTYKKVRNVFLIFIISGFWHGANWTYITWGAINAIYFLPMILLKRNRKNTNTVAENKFLPTIKELVAMVSTFLLTCLTWIFFRAENIDHAFSYISEIFSYSLFSHAKHFPRTLIFLILIFICIEWIGRSNEYAIAKIGNKWNTFFKFSFYTIIIFMIGMFMQTQETPFIYFQF